MTTTDRTTEILKSEQMKPELSTWLLPGHTNHLKQDCVTFGKITTATSTEHRFYLINNVTVSLFTCIFAKFCT